ncbi:MAG: hypothetical protein PHX21_12625 [bacterium]|nr:hypothetical protein [bacterium]
MLILLIMLNITNLDSLHNFTAEYCSTTIHQDTTMQRPIITHKGNVYVFIEVSDNLSLVLKTQRNYKKYGEEVIIKWYGVDMNDNGKVYKTFGRFSAWELYSDYMNNEWFWDKWFFKGEKEGL